MAVIDWFLNKFMEKILKTDKIYSNIIKFIRFSLSLVHVRLWNMMEVQLQLISSERYHICMSPACAKDILVYSLNIVSLMMRLPSDTIVEEKDETD